MRNTRPIIQVHSNESFIAEVYLDAIPRMTVPNWKRLIKILVFENDDANEPARKLLDAWFPLVVQAAKEEWDEKSRVFQREYRNTKLLPRGSRAAVKRKNDQLLAAVRTAKTEYDKLIKLQSVYEDAKKKL